MEEVIHLGGVPVEIVRKDIRNLHLSVYPPAGNVRISAPRTMKLDTIRVFAVSRLAWIRERQKRFREQEREPKREFLERESHYVWGRRCLLRIVEQDAPANIELLPGRLVLHVRPGTAAAKREELLEAWYRDELRRAVPPLLAKWEPLIGVKVRRVFVQRMRTKWGTCTPAIGAIRLNTDLARKPPECLEYIVVHEMAHLLEPTHNPGFAALMDRFLPTWRHLRDRLNRSPLRHEEWQY